MRYTNDLGLPEAFVNAVTRDPYDKGEADFSVTELLKPPQVRHLYQKHGDDLVEDVSDRFWALLGRGVHNVVDQHTDGTPGVSEERLFAPIEVDGKEYTLSGAVDLRVDGSIQDYKVTSVYSVMRGGRDEWTDQLNMYNWLAWKNGHNPDHSLLVNVICRDWMKSQRFKKNYPQGPVVVLPIDSWGVERTEEHIVQLVRDHVEDPPRYCTTDETWNGKRCADWCAVNPFCEQYNGG